ncbi:MAG TPA: hypothetical protein VND45_17075 [Thermoanaerobaculia bacterium]|jgi:hypothetical protein|nr:hypothetical protein [Thermoanaerobaculia bacterium]
MTTFLLLLTLLAATYDNIAIHDNGRSYMEMRGNRELSDLGGRYAYFERDGVAYVIRDAATLDQLRAILRPQVELGEQQAALGRQQAALGEKQAAIGQRQAELGMQQVGASGERSRRLHVRQRELAAQQSELADQQRPLGEQQRVLGARQREASRVAKPKLEKIFADAIRTGIAKKRV